MKLGTIYYRNCYWITLKESQTTVWNTLGGKAHSIYRSKLVIRINITLSWVNFTKQWLKKQIWSPFSDWSIRSEKANEKLITHHSLFVFKRVITYMVIQKVCHSSHKGQHFNHPSIRNGICCSCLTKWHNWRCCIRISKYIFKVPSHGCFIRHNYYRSKNSISTDFVRQR